MRRDIYAYPVCIRDGPKQEAGFYFSWSRLRLRLGLGGEDLSRGGEFAPTTGETFSYNDRDANGTPSRRSPGSCDKISVRCARGALGLERTQRPTPDRLAQPTRRHKTASTRHYRTVEGPPRSPFPRMPIRFPADRTARRVFIPSLFFHMDLE
jgi:hypothetical protein